MGTEDPGTDTAAEVISLPVVWPLRLQHAAVQQHLRSCTIKKFSQKIKDDIYFFFNQDQFFHFL